MGGNFWPQPIKFLVFMLNHVRPLEKKKRIVPLDLVELLHVLQYVQIGIFVEYVQIALTEVTWMSEF